MKVKWEQFAQRRKINLEMFKSLDYNEYVRWCGRRSVEPVSVESYKSSQGFLEPVSRPEETPVEIVTVSTHEFDASQLKKLKKQSLVKLCKEFNVQLMGKETKLDIISLLLSLNNDQ